MLVLSALAIPANATFDGMLDQHFTAEPNFLREMMHQGIIVLCSSILAYGFSFILKAQSRFIDWLGTISMARAPIIVSVLVMFLTPQEKLVSIPEKMANGEDVMSLFGPIELFTLIIGGLVSFLALVYHIQLLWQSWRTCTNRKDTLSVVLFILTIILTESITLYLIREVL